MTVLSIFLQAATGSGMSSILMMVALIAIFYFFMIRPQTKRQKEIRKFRESLTTGDKIVTAGGLFGKIKEVKSDSFIIEIAENTRVRIAKDSVYPSAAEAEPIKLSNLFFQRTPLQENKKIRFFIKEHRFCR